MVVLCSLTWRNSMLKSLAVVDIFFFKQKTAYELRISDWSSDVCSSDLESTVTSVSSHPRCQATATSTAAGRLRAAYWYSAACRGPARRTARAKAAVGKADS